MIKQKFGAEGKQKMRARRDLTLDLPSDAYKSLPTILIEYQLFSLWAIHQVDPLIAHFQWCGRCERVHSYLSSSQPLNREPLNPRP